MSKAITPQQAVDVLNSALAADPEATAALVANRVACNQAMADHPTIQVRGYDETETLSGEGDGFAIGLLGVINGLFGIDAEGWGAIAVVVEEDKRTIAKFFAREGWSPEP